MLVHVSTSNRDRTESKVDILHWHAIPTVTNVDAFEDAVEAFKRGGSRSEYLRKLLALGLPAVDIRFLADCRGRTMTVRER
jgi:hypothetical protein